MASKKKGKRIATSSSSSSSSSAKTKTKTQNRKVKKKKTCPSPPKHHLVTGRDGGLPFYSNLTQEQFREYEVARDKLLHPGCGDDPTNKAQSASFCREFFPLIKSTRLEFADYVLVEPLDVCAIVEDGGWFHMNFTAKHKDAEDSSKALFFAEVCPSMDAVTCLADLSHHSLDYNVRSCCYCHADAEEKDKPFFPVAGGGFVHHPTHVEFVKGFIQVE